MIDSNAKLRSIQMPFCTHVSRLADEPEGMRAQHRLSSRMMAAMPAGEAVTQAR
ncbi:Uncharacterised protein [Escherichia coli]|nr:Uncharacterised protein [Escherichia coli]